MDTKKLFIILFTFAWMLSLIGCAIDAISVNELDSSEPVTLSAPEATSPQVEPETETLSSPIETEPIIEPDPESDYIFYNVPFDIETQKEIIKICSEYDISYELILGIITVESSFRPHVLGDGGKSFGLMQIQPQWWSKTMEREGVTNLLDPLQNIRCGCAILRELNDMYGTEYRALQAYNTGRPDTNNGYAESVYRYIGELTIYGG
jgi:hypothetical protein